MPLLFASGNRGKFEEARAFFASRGIALAQKAVKTPEIQADTLDEVSREKARWLHEKFPTERLFVDDSGLFIDALEGFPGVYSSYVFRTIGIAGVLRLLEGVDNRAARFECAIAYTEPSFPTPVVVKGVCKGRIVEAPRGSHGFGFDPVFVPEGHERTFAELDVAEKNPLSHRGKALVKFGEWLGANG